MTRDTSTITYNVVNSPFHAKPKAICYFESPLTGLKKERVKLNMGYGVAGVGGVGGVGCGGGSSSAAILVLFILLVIILSAFVI